MKRRICLAWLSALLGVDQTCIRCLSAVHMTYPQLCPCPLVSSTSRPASSASSSASRTCFFGCDHLVIVRHRKAKCWRLPTPCQGQSRQSEHFRLGKIVESPVRYCYVASGQLFFSKSICWLEPTYVCDTYNVGVAQHHQDRPWFWLSGEDG